jgi:hypothetical protein
MSGFTALMEYLPDRWEGAAVEYKILGRRV